MATPDSVTCFGTGRARYAILLEAMDVPPDVTDWEDVSVVMVEIVPECYALVVATTENGSDEVVFSSIVGDNMDFLAKEAKREISWNIQATNNRFLLRLPNHGEFWLLMSQISEACTYNIWYNTDTADQLQMAIRSFRTLLVIGSSFNEENPFDGRAEHDVSPPFGNSTSDDVVE